MPISRYGIEKLRDYTYHTWSFQCRMLLSEKKVWKVVTGEYTRPIMLEYVVADDGTEKEVPAATRNKLQREIDDWDEKNEEAIRVISFTVSDQLQGPIRYGKTAKGAWDELQPDRYSFQQSAQISKIRHCRVGHLCGFPAYDATIWAGC